MVPWVMVLSCYKSTSPASCIITLCRSVSCVVSFRFSFEVDRDVCSPQNFIASSCILVNLSRVSSVGLWVLYIRCCGKWPCVLLIHCRLVTAITTGLYIIKLFHLLNRQRCTNTPWKHTITGYWSEQRCAAGSAKSDVCWRRHITSSYGTGQTLI